MDLKQPEIELAPYRVQAHNTALASENKIHDDTVAQRYGFARGLVPGVEVYAYMTHHPVRYWGRAWLEHGSAECRFARPVYDGREAVVSASLDGDRLVLKVESEGVLCATGQASLDGGPRAAPPLDDFDAVAPPGARPPANETSLAPGTRLGIAPFRLTASRAADYLRAVRETDPLYQTAGLAHPGVILRLCNWSLMQNVVLGPWIHAGSRISNFAAARVGDELSVRARVAANYERKGHGFVDLDALVIANARTPVARVTHTAIHRPRQVVGG